MNEPALKPRSETTSPRRRPKKKSGGRRPALSRSLDGTNVVDESSSDDVKKSLRYWGAAGDHFPPDIRRDSDEIPPVWDAILRSINPIISKSEVPEEKVKKCVRKGVPVRVRRDYWATVTGARLSFEKNRGVYGMLLMEPSEHRDKIEKDMNRTLPHHNFFDVSVSHEGQQRLFNVLYAYSVLDDKIGYCQGMSFIAALILLHIEEEEAFWILTQIVKTYRLGDLFCEGLTLLRMSLYQLDRLTEMFLPKLFSHFKLEGVTPLHYASEWFSTLFVYNFPIDVVTRVWDVFLMEGKEYLLNIGLALLKIHQGALLSLEFDYLILYLKDCGKDVDAGHLIKTADSFHISQETFSSLQAEFVHPRSSRESQFL